MLFLSDGSYRGASTGLFGATADTISFVDGFSCTTSQPGIYKWSAQNSSLTLAVVKDDCQNRAGFFGKTTFEKVPESNTSASLVWAVGLTVNSIAIDPQGNIYAQVDYSPEGSRAPQVFYYAELDPNGKLVKNWDSWIRLEYSSMAVDAQGNFYVADFGNAVIQKFDPTKNLINSWSVTSGIAGPSYIAIDTQQNIYIAIHRTHDHFIEKYDTQGKLLGTWAKPIEAGGEVLAGDHSGPGVIAVDANGNTYLEDPPKNGVLKYDANGKFLYELKDVVGAVVDKDGNFYCTDKDTLNILRFDSNGKQTGKWSLPFAGYILQFDKDGNIYVSGNSVLAKYKLPKQ